MRRKFVVGNWKLNGNTQVNSALIADLKGRIIPVDGAQCGICVPSAYVAQVSTLLSGSALLVGAQDASRYVQGAYTGEVSAGMLVDCGARVCIAGHSERRALFGDTDKVVAEKFGHIRQAGMMPILCVGESLAERESGVAAAVVLRQLDSVLSMHGKDALRETVVAYEPVWAIGTGKTATKEQAQEVHALIRSHLVKAGVAQAGDVPILYGGSVKAVNAGELFSMPDIDGALVGGASLIADEFVGIWNAMRASVEN